MFEHALEKAVVMGIAGNFFLSLYLSFRMRVLADTPEKRKWDATDKVVMILGTVLTTVAFYFALVALLSRR